MQATQTTRQFHLGQIKYNVLSFGLIASLAIGAAALTLADAIPTLGGSDSHVVASAQRTSDQLYALEASLAGSQVDGWQASVGQLTSDEAWAIEASLVAAAAAHQHNQIMQLTPDYQFIEQNLQLPANDIAPVTDGAVDYRFLELNLELPATTAHITPDWRTFEYTGWREGFISGGATSAGIDPSATVAQPFPVGFSH